MRGKILGLVLALVLIPTTSHAEPRQYAKQCTLNEEVITWSVTSLITPSGTIDSPATTQQSVIHTCVKQIMVSNWWWGRWTPRGSLES